MSALTIPILLGTARVGRYSESVARYVLERARAFGFDSALVDIRDHLTPMTVRRKDDPSVGTAWTEIIAQANALIIVSPEYNHGYPGELKILLDKLSAKDYADLPIGIVGVSNGTIGGARMIQSLVPVLVDLTAIVTRAATVNVKNVEELFDDQGRITDTSYDKRLTKLFDELQRLAERFPHVAR